MSQIDNEQSFSHEPVLLDEVVEWLEPRRGGIYLDCTLGLGGHAEAILAASSATSVVGMDQDTAALERAKERLAPFGDRVQFIHANFRDVANVLGEVNVGRVQGVLADLGVSSLQFDDSERGFSFSADAPLDMRMNRDAGETAAELIARLAEKELADLIFAYGDERGSRRIARLVVKERERAPIETTKQLADLVVRALRVPGRWRIHPATRTFQALRIAVNDELKALEAFIPAAISTLSPGGRLAVISFHSLEDRIVKRAFRRESGRCVCEAKAGGKLPVSPVTKKQLWEVSHDQDADDAVGTTRPLADGAAVDEVVCERCGSRRRVTPLTRKPVRPSDEEMARNPRSRSALLRVCERI